MFTQEELSELRKDTERLIEGEGIEITLLREQMIRTPSGGTRREEKAPVPGGPVKRILWGTTSDPFIQRTNAGEIVNASHVLIGLMDDDIVEKDEFVVDDRTFQVQEVHPEREFQTKAWILEKK